MKKISLTKELKISLTQDEQFDMMKTLITSYPNVAITILENLNKVHCPFPFICTDFPCKSLSCNADVCDNGYTYRMS